MMNDVCAVEEAKRIELLPTQVGHAHRLKTILLAHPLALDLSMLGAGKTFTASSIALDEAFGFKRVVVIAPVSVLPKWDDIRSTYKVPITNCISYSRLRSVKCKQPRHGLLMRRDYTIEMTVQGGPISVDKVEFSTTARFRQYVAEGVLLIIDEIQSIKNVSSQFLACRTMIRAIVESFHGTHTGSRAILLSGSPIDRQEQVVTLFRTMNVMRCDELAAYNLGRREYEWRGLRDIETHCRELDNTMVERLRMKHSRGDGVVRPSHVEVYCYDLFQQVFKPARASVMPVPCLNSRVHKLNAFFEVADLRERVGLTFGVEALSKACSFNSTTGQVGFLNAGGATALASLRMITRSLLQIETGKIGTFVRAASALLDRSPNAKVVICVNYSATLRDLQEGLSRYAPLILDGSTCLPRRASVLRLFQTPSTDHRLLIGNVSVMSTGIDLDDKDGRFPRTALVNPSYSTIALYQLGHRFLRADTRSDADVLFVFGKHATEMHVLQALARKAGVMKQTTCEQSKAGVVFPGDYQKVDGDLHLLHQERVLVRVVEPTPEDDQGPSILGVEALETLVADGDENNPALLEDQHLSRIAAAAEQETLEVPCGGNVHVEDTGDVDASTSSPIQREDTAGPFDVINLTQQIPHPQLDEDRLVALCVPEHALPSKPHDRKIVIQGGDEFVVRETTG